MRAAQKGFREEQGRRERVERKGVVGGRGSLQ